ncbi:MAG: flagellar biosynthesis protein FlgE [Rhodobacterales bacterium]|nr:MAG: flagellar biosynthesis protein FlgE [Rhodobacterales bacterium]
MTISSSLSAGVAGLAANASRLATISDNIANSATYGYKRAVTDFHSLVTNSGTGSYSAGGVRTTSARMVSESGPVVTTSNPTDLAVTGRGMLPVTSVTGLAENNTTPDVKLVTTGSFKTNADGFLTTSGGLALMGWAANPDGTIGSYPQDTFAGLTPIQINTKEYAGSATTDISLSVNLAATETEAGASGDPRTMSVEYFDHLAKSQNLQIEFTPTVPATGASNEWSMAIRDGASGGAVIGEYVLTFDNTPASGGTLAAVTAVTGAPYAPATGTLPLTTPGGTIALDIGIPGQPGRLSQISDKFAPGDISKNGYAAGNLTAVEVDAAGRVQAYYDNGVGRTIAQIPLVDVPNVDGLRVHDDQTYTLSKDSGDFLLWAASEGPTGEILSFAREESATDVARELTDLIRTQRAYSSNAKIIQTVDEMLQETTNMKR